MKMSLIGMMNSDNLKKENLRMTVNSLCDRVITLSQSKLSDEDEKVEDSHFLQQSYLDLENSAKVMKRRLEKLEDAQTHNIKLLSRKLKRFKKDLNSIGRIKNHRFFKCKEHLPELVKEVKMVVSALETYIDCELAEMDFATKFLPRFCRR